MVVLPVDRRLVVSKKWSLCKVIHFSSHLIAAVLLPLHCQMVLAKPFDRLMKPLFGILSVRDQLRV